MKKTGIVFLFAMVFLFNHGYSFSENTIKGAIPREVVEEDINLSDFIVGPGDKVEIKVYRNDDLNSTVQIDPSGKITYPLLGDVQASGLTVFQLRDNMAKGLSRFLKDPQVVVNLTSYQSHKITVLGEVANPGLVSMDSQPTVLEVISRSGGFGANADKGNVVVIRKKQGNSTVIPLNLKKALEGDKTQDVLLKRDDIVYIPTVTNKLTVLGEVTNPGVVVLDRELNESPMTLLDAVIKVGGFGSNADKTGVVIIRKNGDNAETRKFDIKKVLEEGDLSQNAVIQKGDIVYVPKIDQRVVVMGEVAAPGTVQLDMPIRIFEAISKVGGFSANANKNNIILIRDDKGESRLMSIDMQKALESGDISQNLLLQKGDVIYVPRDNKRIIILGEVASPGYFSYDTPLTIVDAVSKAGGFTSNANEKKVALIRKGVDKQENVKLVNLKKVFKEGDVENGSLILQNGDIVYVPTTFIADVETVLAHIRSIFSTFTSVESPVIMWPQFKDVFKGGKGTGTIVVPSSQ